MKRQDIEAKLTKAQEVVTKKEALLQKYIKKEEKVRQHIIDSGWDLEAGAYQKYGTKDHEDCYWTFCDWSDALENIKRTEKVIIEKKAIVEKWETKLGEEISKEAELDKIPDILKQYREVLIQSFDKNDQDRKDFYRQKFEELGYKEFVKKYHYTAREFMLEPAEETHKKNVKTAENLITNLWTRVKDICKDVTDCNLYLSGANEWEGICINGLVTGSEGTAKVESITAGGWNIQKLHIRTLVHKI